MCALLHCSLASGQNAPRADEPRAKPTPQAVKLTKVPEFEIGSMKTSSGIATWYQVGPNSLPMRRAPGELIAAHDSLPLGSYVRVTSKKTGLSVIVRITDRGVRKRGVIDLCKEAAEKIGLVGYGIVKVQMDVLKPKTAIAVATPAGSPNPASNATTVAPAVIPKDAILPPVPSP